MHIATQMVMVALLQRDEDKPGVWVGEFLQFLLVVPSQWGSAIEGFHIMLEQIKTGLQFPRLDALLVTHHHR